MIVKFACTVPAMVYLDLPENVLMVEIHVICFGFKNKGRVTSILQW